MQVHGFSLYCISDALNNFGAPYTVVAVKSANSNACFFNVEFSSLPDYTKYGFQIENVNGYDIIFMPEDLILPRDDCIEISGGSWQQVGFKFHVLGALHDLDLNPPITAATLQLTDSSEIHERDLQRNYNVYESLPMALLKIFSDIYFGYHFFGYTETDDEQQKLALNYAEKISKQLVTPDLGCTFDFGALRFATERFNNTVFPNRKGSKTISSDLYKQVLDITQSVSMMLRTLGFNNPDDDFKTALYNNTKNFQKKFGINEVCCGKKTLRALIFKSIHIGGQQSLINSIISPKSKNQPKIILDRFSGIPPISDDLDNFPNLELRSNEVSNQISKSVGGTAHAAFNISERIGRCEARLSEIGDSIAAVQMIADSIESQIDSTISSIEELLESHSTVEEQLQLYRNRIIFERRENRAFAAIAIIVLFLSLRRIFIAIFF